MPGPDGGERKKPNEAANATNVPSSAPDGVSSWPPSLLAALSKSILSPFGVAGLFKALAKNYFRSPARLFRPSRVPVSPSTLMVARLRARFKRGKDPNLVKPSLALVAPLVAFNSASGLLLFHSYQMMHSALPDSALSPALAGAFSGSLTALLTTPLENLYRVLPPDGNPRTLRIRVKEASKGFSGPRTWKKLQFAYSGLVFAAMKDALGFSLFFGVYTALKQSRPVSRFLPAKSNEPDPTESTFIIPPKALDILLAGSLSGAAFQLATIPLDRIRTAVVNARADRIVFDPLTGEMESTSSGHRMNGNGNNNGNGNGNNGRRKRGILKAIRTLGWKGITKGLPGLVARAVVPSAAALGVYEWAKTREELLKDEEDEEGDDVD